MNKSIKSLRYCVCLAAIPFLLLFSTRAEAQFTPAPNAKPDLAVSTTLDTLPRGKKKPLFEASPGVDRKLLTFEQRNSGAFKRKKKGGLKSPGMAALCSAVLPGLGQIYNGQWYKAPVLYAGVGVLAYFTDQSLRGRNFYGKEIKARVDSTGNLNPKLADYSLDEILSLRNYYEQNFELCLIIAGAVYLLNIVDAIVYAHLSSFNVSPNLAMSVKPYARTNFNLINSFPLDAGIKICLTLK
ncbi:MAG: DUF5683 domain-containing protein [Bacteroides sp.]|nr:DUF5683 domain-containing protein [Bacteroides sp.]